MIIKSRFKDYYDFVATKYGGGDPKVVYVRDRIAPLERSTGDYLTGPRESWVDVELDKDPLPDPASTIWAKQDFSLRWLVIAGKAYMLYRAGNPQSDLTNLSGFMIMNPAEVGKKIKLKYYWSANRWVKDMLAYHGQESKPVIELCRTVGAPVFVVQAIHRRYISGPNNIVTKVKIHGQCPILANMGAPALIPPEQMYQDLSYFMGNTMNSSPDKAPPVEVGNQSKILNAGFDLRWSFRHRIEEK